VLLFVDATQRTVHNVEAPYELARALHARGETEQAVAAYGEALERVTKQPGHVIARRAANGLASLLAERGQLEQAEVVLRKAWARFPGDATVRGNLVKVLRAQGKNAEAAVLEKR